MLPRVSKRKPLEFFHFKVIYLRSLPIKPYFYVLGCQIYCFPNLFYEKGSSFCGLKIVVHLDFENNFHTQNCFDEFGSCGSPNYVYDSFLESPICLFSFPKISAFFVQFFLSSKA